MRPPLISLGLGFGAAFGLGALVTHLPDSFASAKQDRKAEQATIEVPAAAVAAATPNVSFAPLVDAVRPAVVSIEVESERRGATMDLSGVPAPFRRFFDEGSQRPVRGEGSGFVITADGYVLTNNHVIDKASTIVAQFADGREVTATVVGTDPATDVALLKLDGDESWPHVELGTSSTLRVGDWVVAVGNPLGLGITVTAGIVSGTGRVLGHDVYDDFIQTDAAINQGNSGGPLFDTNGRVVGMNTAIIQGANTVGFAVPSDLLADVLEDLQTDGRVSRGYIGVQLQQMDVTLATALGKPDAKGALVASVEAGTPASSAGLESGDIIVGIGDREIDDSQSLIREVAKHDPGEKIAVRVLRKGKTRSFDVTLAERPGRGGSQPADRPADRDETHTDRLGIRVMPLPPNAAQSLGTDRGVVIGEVDPDGAAHGKLRRGDVIQQVDGKPIRTPEELGAALTKARTPVVLQVIRDGQVQLVAIDR